MDIAPPDTVISAAAKLVVASLEVNVKVSVASFVVAPSATAVPLLLAAVMVMVGGALSFKFAVLLFCVVEAAFPAASKIALLAGEIVITSLPSAIPERFNPSV